MIILQMLRGFCMALADSVPGVSGGTVAFLLGFYDKFIAAVDDLLTGNWQKKKKAFLYLIQIGIGWAIGMVLAILAITSIFESHIYIICSAFVGLIIFAIPLIIKDEWNCIKTNLWGAIYTILGCVLVILVTRLHPHVDFDLSRMNVGLAAYIVFCGFISMAVMILPGMSGSTTLLILGMYLPILESVKALMHFDFSVLPVVLLFILGVVLGILLASKAMNKLLEKHRPSMIYLIIGLMLGSIYSVLQGPTTLENPLPAIDVHTFNFWAFILGGVIIVGLQLLSQLKTFKKEK